MLLFELAGCRRGERECGNRVSVVDDHDELYSLAPILQDVWRFPDLDTSEAGFAPLSIG